MSRYAGALVVPLWKRDWPRGSTCQRDNERIEKLADSPTMDAAVEWRERLGGVLNYYYRRAG